MASDHIINLLQNLEGHLDTDKLKLLGEIDKYFALKEKNKKIYLGEITVATLHSLHFVNRGRAVAGMRVIPLLIEDAKLQAMERLVIGPVIEILPLKFV